MSDSETEPSYESDPSENPSEVLSPQPPPSPQSSTGSSPPLVPPIRYIVPILVGNTFFEGYPASTLFSTASSHSFVSEGFLDSINMHSDAVDDRLTIASPFGALVSPNRITAGVVTLTMDVRFMSFNVTMRVMQTRDYELILGVDWMAASRAMIDMEERRISVWTESAGRDWFAIE